MALKKSLAGDSSTPKRKGGRREPSIPLKRRSAKPNISPKKSAPKRSSRSAAPEKQTEETRQETAVKNRFPVVGIGASAGGLEAFTLLLQHLPADTGMGFVLVQHLDPVHESALTKLLSKTTSMPVRDVANNLPVEANHVYVIPPNTTLSIVKGVLKLHPRKKARTPTRSIDSFLESLAEDQRERAIGVILSGTASDGTVGLEAIKAEGGITFAQDDSAKYDSMPRSAVAAGCVDFVLSPAEIAAELARIAKHPYVAGHALQSELEREGDQHGGAQGALASGGRGTPRTGSAQARAEAEAPPTGGDSSYRKILLLLRNHCGVDFSLYKSNTIQRRINRRMVLNKADTLDDYANFLKGNSKELDALYSDALISVTSFFRNPEAFEILKRKVFPKLLGQRGDDPFRVWVLGCSTGQEAYSIAMTFMESAEKAPRLRRLQIFATDLNESLLEKARNGLYTKSLAEDVSPERLRRFFVEEEGGYRIVKSLREMVVFARQNLISDPPFSRMDLISCRNLLIYLEQSLQKKALPTFHYALKPGGFLFLGASESVGSFAELFEPIDKKQKIYSKKAAPTPTFHLPVSGDRSERTSSQALRPSLLTSQDELPASVRGELNAQREADRMSVNRFAPPGVLINEQNQILQFRGPTSVYLQPPASGKASFDVLKMAREGLMLPLRSTINKARRENKIARRKNVRVKQNGEARSVNIEVVPLKNLRERCFLILFEDAEKAHPGRTMSEVQPTSGTKTAAPQSTREESRRIAELESELAERDDYLQSIQEQYEAASEELQASNEEVQSANEELQSINEELETSKEELESANEELTTVNEEMAYRNVELNRLNSDLTNLQTSTKLAIVLLGRDLSIRRFSAQAEKQFNLLASDVGRPMANVRHNLDLPELEDFIGGVISSVREREREVQDKTGRWYSLRVRPYISLENKVDGAVLVLVDITDLKKTEQQIRDERNYAQAIIRTVQHPLLVLDDRLRVETANDSFYRTFQVPREQTEGRLIYELGNRQWDIPALRMLLEEILPQKTFFADFEVTHTFETIGPQTMLLSAAQLESKDGTAERILLGIESITERKLTGEALRENEELYRALFELSPMAVYTVDASGVILNFNRHAAELWGRKPALGDTNERFCGSFKMFRPDGSFMPHEQCPVAEVVSGKVSEVHNGEVQIERPDGSQVTVLVNIRPLKNDRGEVTGAINCFYDITERKQTEEELKNFMDSERAARAQAEDANRVKDEFLATISHELRTPLNAILGWAHMLVRGKLNEANAAHGIQVIERNAKAQSQLIADLLDVSRIITGKFRFEQGAIELIPIIEAAIETVRPAAEAKGVDLTLIADPAAGLISGDANRLQQVVWNLLTNAVKYTPRNGHIEVELKRHDTSAAIVIQDSGEGIEPEFLPYIFDRFRQADGTTTRQHSGLGLGLAIVRQLVESHGGTVRAGSKGLGQGSTFTVTLPLMAVRNAEPETRNEAGDTQENSESEGRQEGANLAEVRVLVVDDEPDARELLMLVLTQRGADVRVAATVDAALQTLAEWKPDVLVSDIGMPKEDGYALMRRLRARKAEEGGGIPALALTGYASPEDNARALKAGYQVHMSKPISPTELVLGVAKLARRM